MKNWTEQITGTDCERVFLENDRGVLAELLSYGACIRRAAVLRGGKWLTLTQSFADIREYIQNNTAYDGKTLAPCAGRFSSAEGIRLDDGYIIHPEANERGMNCLHGGAHSVSVQNWMISDLYADNESASVVFTTDQKDGTDGWPGNRNYLVKYTLDNENRLSIHMEAYTDKNTYINMSNHAYWNLNIDSDRAMDQRIILHAEGYVCNSESSGVPCRIIPLHEIEAENGIQFGSGQMIRELMVFDTDTGYAGQNRLGKGLNNAFTFSVTEGERPNDRCLCTLMSEDRAIQVSMYSDAPAMVIYASGSMNEGLDLENGQVSGKNCSAAFEFQQMPTVQKPVTLHPGEIFSRNIVFRFSF